MSLTEKMIIQAKNSCQHFACAMVLAFASISTAFGQSTPQPIEAQRTPSSAIDSETSTDLVQGKILTIFSYHPGMEWTDSLLAGYENKLNFYPNIELYTEFLDAKRHPTLVHSEAFLESLRDKYTDKQPDVLMIGDDPAFELIQERTSEVFPGVYEVHDAKPTLDIAMEFTNATGAAVISTTTETGVAHEHAAIEAYPDLEWVIIRDIVSKELQTPPKTDLNHLLRTMHHLLEGIAKGCEISLQLHNAPLIKT